MRKVEPKTNEEALQSLTRLVISGLISAFYLVKMVKSGSGFDDPLGVVFSGILAYFLFSLPWYFWVRKTPRRFPHRRYLSVCADLGLISWALHLSGPSAPYFYPLYLWVIIGNGLRFGRRFLVLGVVVGVLGFGSLLLINPFWIEHQRIGYGLLASVVILPLFFLKVLNRTHKLNIRLEEELEKSQTAEKAKGEFLANMSHEIRTPMNGVLGMVEVLGDTQLDSAQRKYLSIIQRSADSLLNILNDILDYSKIVSGKLELEAIPIDLKETLKDVVRLLRPSAEDKGITLDFDFPKDQPKTFLADSTRIRQIVFNLLGNGLKFTEHGSVVLRCRCSEENKPNNVVLEIQDTGIGIPNDRLDSIFEQFEQAESGTTRKFGGTGLGLAICRQLASLMDGDVQVNSVLDQGTTFTVNLTLPFSEEYLANRCQNQELPNYGLKALVAEDNKVNQLVVRKLLEKVGITIELAENGKEALALLADNDYDLVFMDVRMPIMNGLEATETIRSSNMAQKDIPIIALTANASAEDAKRCILTGMDAHLRKPLKLEELMTVMDKMDLAPACSPPQTIGQP